MSKIKSIKVNQLELDRIVANANNSDLAQLEYLHKINPLLFEIEYESETRYWPNGALFNKPDDDTCVWCVGSSLELKKYVVQTQDHFGDYKDVPDQGYTIEQLTLFVRLYTAIWEIVFNKLHLPSPPTLKFYPFADIDC